MKLLRLGKRNKWIYFIFLSIFRNFVKRIHEVTSSRQKNKRVCFVLHSTFRNFVALKGGGLFRKVS